MPTTTSSIFDRPITIGNRTFKLKHLLAGFAALILVVVVVLFLTRKNGIVFSWAGDFGGTFDRTELSGVAGDVSLRLQTGINSPDGWFDTSWKYRIKVTLNNADINEDLTDFPVLVKLDSSNFNFDFAAADGHDVRIIASDNKTRLEAEMVVWDKENKIASMWVKVPFIKANSVDSLNIYFGNPGAAAEDNSRTVWDSGFLTVQHLEEDPLMGVTGFIDSTQNNNNGKAEKVVPGFQQKVPSAVDYGAYFNGQGTRIAIPNNEQIDLGALDDSYTVEAFLKWEGGDGRHAVSKGQLYWGNGIVPFNLGIDSIDPRTGVVGRALFMIAQASESPIYAGLKDEIGIREFGWHYLVGVRDAANKKLRVYLDGRLTGEIDDTSTASSQRDHSILIGSNIGNESFVGLIDEVRVSNIVRSSEWIKAQGLNFTLQFAKPELVTTLYATQASWESASDKLISVPANAKFGSSDEADSTALVAAVRSVSATNKITVQVRFANTAAEISAKEYQTLAVITEGPDFTLTKAELDQTGVMIGDSQVMQVKVVIESDGVTDVQLDSLTINYH